MSWPETSAAEPAYKNQKLRAICAHTAMPDDTDLQPNDFHVAVKRREHSQLPWRWEIWAAGRTKATAQSEEHYATMSEAIRAGKAALRPLLKNAFPAI